MGAVHCSCRTNCNTRNCHWKNKDLIATLPVQTPDEYYVPMWCLVLNQDLGWCCFKKAFSYKFTSVYGKIIYSSSRNNGKFNLLLSFKGRKYHVCRGRMGIEKTHMGLWASQIHCCNVRASIAINHTVGAVEYFRIMKLFFCICNITLWLSENV